jgi:serine/threonine protein kinase
MSFQPGDVIGEKYKVIKKIGAGSFGTIFLAEHM